MREDAGLSRRVLATAADLDDRYLGQVERGEREPSITVLVALATALGGDAHVRLYPGTGPRLRDPLQAQIVEALLRIAHPRWERHLEVPVYRPVRGVIDVVLVDRAGAAVVAVEVHSELRRLEQQLRWANEKAAALPSSAIWPPVGAVTPTVHRLMVLRSTRTNRALTTQFATTLVAAYPAAPQDALQALVEPAAGWPGSAWLWATTEDHSARIHAPA